MSTTAEPPTPFVSTGKLPDPAQVQTMVEAAHQRFASDVEGDVSRVYPALAEMNPDFFGICLAGVTGRLYHAGDWEESFSIMSISKPLVFALVADSLGVEVVREKVGVNATGGAFDSLQAIENHPRGRTNPMVNSGAIATTSLAPGSSMEEKWGFIQEGLSRFAGRALQVNEDMLASALASNFRNRAIAFLLQSRGAIYDDPLVALEIYTRQCCLEVTARDLALMAATLADGGVHPLSRQRVISPSTCHYTAAVMVTAGLYDTSGDWLYDIGLPAKSGIGGGILAFSPGKGGLGTFAPRLDAAGNSVKGQKTAKFLSHYVGLDLFVSAPATKETD